MYLISWSSKALSDYHFNIDYLLNVWTFKEAEEFVNNAFAVINMIKVLPQSFPFSEYENVRKALVCKQITLYYAVNKSEVILLRFWNNYQNPESFTY